MTEPTEPSVATVWAVRLGAAPEETEGTLTLEESELVFAAEDGELRIPLVTIRRAKRIRGSPVLLVEQETSEGRADFAFYFSKPPPLPGPGESKRKTRRRAVGYLGVSNRERKHLLKAWQGAIEARVGRSRS
ncbi:MAG: hypothetical protein WD276_04285 [Actinomycetota bacterium]